MPVYACDMLVISHAPMIVCSICEPGLTDCQLLTPACFPGMKPGISHEAGSEPSEMLYRQLFRAPGQPAPHLLPEEDSSTRGAFNLTKGQAFVNDLLLTGETAVANLTGSLTARCDALALDGGPGGHPKVSLQPLDTSHIHLELSPL